ncbi:endonuclease domain-containing 1 protein-like [Hypomesus transpacificus]|uniref:endonuclease domain-containing 1 protein-like n=1 Tax=Hypomesus transpacificus TaxID=137520 RepID=UPI001F080EE5|nr:endonuclease domain-containing 1 protein-like [Hypomesus transpacificus]
MKINCLFLLTVLLAPLSQGEVTSFSKCKQFFVNGVAPTILVDLKNNNRYQQICQCLLDQNDRPVYYYATLYDTANKIPVYSAYEFQHQDVDRTDKWYVEPQLDGGVRTCMGGLSHIPSIDRGRHQAVGKDYDGSGFDKGHLYPVHHTSTQASMLATSTLTNAAPQDPGFNRGQWRKHEEGLALHLGVRCSRAHVVTGVVPGNTQIGNGVRVARFYWRAYCCLETGVSLTSEGYFGPDNNGRVETLTVRDLETRLTGYYGMRFSVFGGKCR